MYLRVSPGHFIDWEGRGGEGGDLLTDSGLRSILMALMKPRQAAVDSATTNMPPKDSNTREYRATDFGSEKFHAPIETAAKTTMPR